MKYQHSHHAGNFADVHKHVSLLAVLDAVTRKETPFLFVDTHAGRGIYQSHEAAQRDGEAARGLQRLIAAAAQDAQLTTGAAAPIGTYLQRVAALRAERRDASACPGSPWLAATCLRPIDRAAAFELEAAEHSALRRALEYFPQFSTDQDDGLKRLRGLLPPRERRAVVLIDPPYESPKDEQRRVLETLVNALQRFATGVYMLWFPLKTLRDAEHWQHSLSTLVSRPVLYAQLGLYPLDARSGLNASGIAIINPPFRLFEGMAPWLARLHFALDPDGHGASQLCMLAARGKN